VIASRAARVVRAVWPPVLFGVLILGAWEAAVELFDWKPYFLPAPSAIADAIAEYGDLIARAARVSGLNALVGLVIGTLLGVAVSFLLMRFNVLNDMIGPLAIALNAIPIFVLVSVFYNQFSQTSEVPRRLMVTLVVYFVVLVNVAKGLRQVQPTHLELLRSYAASPVDVLRKARVPNAVPYLFTALRIAAPGAVITAFVAEYFGGAQNGLGSRISSNISTSKNAVAWAYVFGAVVLGLTFYLVSTALESLINRQRGVSPQGEST
jgi:NitT/TauT family transport system permease protein